MPFVEHDQMIQTFSAYGADDAFAVRILLWRAWCDWNFFNTHAFDTLGEVVAVDVVAIANEKTWCFLVREGVDDLLDGDSQAQPLAGEAATSIAANSHPARLKKAGPHARADDGPVERVGSMARVLLSGGKRCTGQNNRPPMPGWSCERSRHKFFDRHQVSRFSSESVAG
jgi:hypothetical protein